MIETLEVSLLLLTIASSIAAVEHPRLTRAIAAFLIMSIAIAVLFFLLGAYIAAFFQMLIYAGAVVVLFLVTLHTVKRW
ncbi:MAG: NADH-quinone oxidoreductase subunit J [Candidatus Nezhaarchaeota archaeon]|nr:NADH-quinone oxidoreductase subunit J [Candidatus Nezhaarchaeota archaeon]